MTATINKEIWRGRRGKDNQDRAREYTRVFQVTTDSFFDGPIVVLSAAGLPRLYDPYVTLNEEDLGAFCVEITPTQQEDPCDWEVVCLYKAKIERLPDKGKDPAKEAEKASNAAKQQSGQEKPKETPNNANISDDPTKRQPTVRTHTVRIAKAVEQDKDGDACVMSSGERIDPPLTKEEIHTIVTVETFEGEGPGHRLLQNMANAINKDVFTFPNGMTVGAGTAKFLAASTEETFENGKLVVRSTFEFEVAPKPWNPTYVMDRGYLRIDPATGEAVPIRDPKTGHVVTSPRLLNGAGDISNGPVFLPFDLYDEADFRDFGF